ncbi:MAG: tRNA-dihydrouridine synthase [Anaerolineales bacterium]|nr:tRNA-dihydrouridine synthase [Anaerolineales bacterium]MCB8937564.1 tRNA-dihydrouridine synthase [Ardenticatenaceae bacterium]
MHTPTFHVRNLPIYGDTILSPMAAYSDVPFRAICRQFGAALHYTEFVPTEALLGDPNPLWRRLDVHPASEHPMVFQIFGNDAQQILYAAQRIEGWGADIIDINMGCSVPKVSEKGAGVGMMRQPKLVAETFRLLSTHLHVPVTGKLRLGWDEASENYLEIAKIMVDNGAALVALHGRFRSQKYRGQANWDAIAKLKQSVNVPVLGNGDVQTVADIDRLKAHTGCDGVMIGRAALGNPWLLARVDREQLTFGQITAVLRQHLHEAISYYGTQDGLQNINRHLKKYLSGLALKQFLRAFQAVETITEFEKLLGVMETAVPATIPIAELRKIPYFCTPVP